MQKYSGESSHLLLGIDSHMWVEFVVSSKFEVRSKLLRTP